MNNQSKYGIITKDNLVLYPLNCQSISLKAIDKIKIIKKPVQNNLFKYFKTDNYDFTIVLDNEKEVKFSFSKRNLNSAIAFKTLIWHTKFSLQNSIP